MLDQDQEEARQGSQPGEEGAESRLKTLLLDGESADESRTEQQQNKEQLAAGAGKGAAQGGVAREAKNGAVEDGTSKGKEQGVPHGRDKELHEPAPGRAGRDPKDDQRSS